jgi:hypothetical protein
LRGTREQQRCRAPVWLGTTTAALDDHQDLGDDERSSRSSEFF